MSLLQADFRVTPWSDSSWNFLSRCDSYSLLFPLSFFFLAIIIILKKTKKKPLWVKITSAIIACAIIFLHFSYFSFSCKLINKLTLFHQWNFEMNWTLQWNYFYPVASWQQEEVRADGIFFHIICQSFFSSVTNLRER